MVGRFELGKPLSRSDTAEVVLARAQGEGGFERYVVVKKLLPELAGDRGTVDAFLAEARLAATLHHTNIATVHDIGEEDGVPYFAMEYVHGEEVRRVLANAADKGEPVPLAQVLAIGIATATALHHAHEKDIVHRDVSPGNVLLGYDGGLKVVDFGIARAALRTAQTQTAMLRGKAPYMSPEQCSGKALDRRSDVFSLGVVLYELLAGRRLFKASNEYLTMAAIVACKVPPVGKWRAELPKAVEEAVMRALARAPGGRFATAAQLAEALEAAATGADVRPTLAGFVEQTFGARAEPWTEGAVLPPRAPVDFDGKGTGLAPPPADALAPPKSIPRVASGRSSPIEAARAQAAAVPVTMTAGPSTPVVIPSATPAPAAVVAAAPAGRKKSPTKVPGPAPSKPRGRPKTIQIPQTSQARTVATGPFAPDEQTTAIVDELAAVPVSGAAVADHAAPAPAPAPTPAPFSAEDAATTIATAEPMIIEDAPTNIAAAPVEDAPTNITAPPVEDAPTSIVPAGPSKPAAFLPPVPRAQSEPAMHFVGASEPISALSAFVESDDPAPRRKPVTQIVAPLPPPAHLAEIEAASASEVPFAMQPTARRDWRKYAIGGGIAAVLLIIIAIAASGGGSSEPASAPSASAVPVPAAPVPAAPLPPPKPTPAPVPVQPAIMTPPAASPAGAIDTAAIAPPAAPPPAVPPPAVPAPIAAPPIAKTVKPAPPRVAKPLAIAKTARPTAKPIAKPTAKPIAKPTAKLATRAPVPAAKPSAVKPTAVKQKTAAKPAVVAKTAPAKTAPAKTAPAKATPAKPAVKAAAKPAPATKPGGKGAGKTTWDPNSLFPK